ncbi:E3 ubiquitin-protein ligase NHLRC1 isoform X2 [Syngnathus scovelli]|uniref:E3 ubiquitin-protein ligase NHLRC1 isoform X2 n=1 Tax=Syngnathus scovelli TaxID=161590 RepID=UPI0021105865|nr:E3 ubiquitin-protein ligase NHLRC1 isoform X2 [Syngnathus scovelli]
MTDSCRRHGDIMRPEGTLREIRINLLECKVCFEKFNTQQAQRRPQNLSCGHVLCVECVGALSHPLLRKLECPFCRQLCHVDATSHCQPLSDLQELLLFTPDKQEDEEEVSGVSGKTLQLSLTFGGWGTLINPTGLAVMPSSGTLFVVHEGEKSVVVFTPQGKKRHAFGKRGHAAEEVFTSRGNHVITVKAGFSMPWGVDTDSNGRILVSDVQAGTLSRIKVDYKHGVTLEEGTVASQLDNPKAVACCRTNYHTAVMEHVTEHIRKQSYSRLTVFTPDFHILYQTDNLSLSLTASVTINMSAVTFDRNGHLLVVDSHRGMIWTFGRVQSGAALAPLVAEHLIRPVGLVPLNNTLIIVDGGDHTVKLYS